MTSDQKFVTKLIIYSGLTLYLIGDLFIWDGFFATKIHKHFVPYTAPVDDNSAAIATVYGEPITQNQLDLRARELAYRKGISGDFKELPPDKQYQFLIQAQYDLIRETLLRLKTRLHAKPQDHLVANATQLVDQLAKNFDQSDEQFVKILRDAGYQQKDFITKVQARLNQSEHLLESTQEANTPTDEELKTYYEELKPYFVTADSRSVKHIFLATLNKDNSVVKQQAEELFAQIKNGSDFEQVAKKFSEDPQSAKQGGNLGFITANRASVIPGIDIFTLESNLPLLIQSDWGWHIIEASPIAKGKQLSFEEAKPHLLSASKDIRKNKAVDIYIDNVFQAARRTNRLKAQPITLEIDTQKK